MNVVIYARYSSYNQTEQSIEGQLKACYEYAKENNYIILKEYIDRAQSGTNDNRAEFQKMIQDSKNNIFNAVLVYQFDRFARNRYDSAIYKKELKKNNVAVISVKEPMIEGPEGIMLEGMLESWGEYYSADLSRKVVRGLGLNAEKGYFTGGTVPFGFKLVLVEEMSGPAGKKIKKQRYEIDEEKAFFVKEIYEKYKNGETMTDIARYLNKRGFKTAYGNDFNVNSVRYILTNKKNIGIYEYKGKEIYNVIPPIIDEQTFNEVQKMLNKNKRAPARAKANIEYLLTTKIFCGTCKEMMVGVSGTSATKNTYYYYSCNGKRKHICNRKNIQKDYIEDIVVNQARTVLTDKNIDMIATNIMKLVESEKNNNERLKQLEKNLQNREKQIKNLISSLKECDIDSVRKTIFQEIENMQKEQEQIQNEILFEKSQDINITKEEIKFFLTKMRKGDINDIRYRKILINVLIDKIYVFDDHLLITFNVKDKRTTNIKMPDIDTIESSYLVQDAQPKNENRSKATIFIF